MAYDNMEQFPYKDGYSGLIYDGVNLGEECEMFILGRGTFNAPSRDVSQIHVPGRNGDILIDNGGWNNVEVTYPDCAILSNFNENVEKLRGYLLSKQGYHELIDPYHPDEFRYAEFRGPFTANVHTGNGNDSGMFDLTFNCRPQRFLSDYFYNYRVQECPFPRSESGLNYSYQLDVDMTNYRRKEFVIMTDRNYGFDFEVFTLEDAYWVESNGTKTSYTGPTTLRPDKLGCIKIQMMDDSGKYHDKFTGKLLSSRSINAHICGLDPYKNEKTLFYYKYENDIILPLINPTPFSAYPAIDIDITFADKNKYVDIGCSGWNMFIDVSNLSTTYISVEIDGTDRVFNLSSGGAINEGIFGDFPMIAGGLNLLSIRNVERINNNGVFYINPKYYRI